MTKHLSDALGIPYESTNKEEIQGEVGSEIVTYDPPAELSDEDADYILVRKTLRNLIEKGNDAIEEIAHIAKQNESARGFEVVSNLIKTVGETSKDLYSLQKQKKDLREPEAGKKLDETNITVDKAVFVGTTAELLSMMKEKENTND